MSSVAGKRRLPYSKTAGAKKRHRAHPATVATSATNTP